MADDKLETKKILLSHGINTTRLIAAFYSRDDIKNFDWESLPESGFALKPARGYGGGGILAFKKWYGDHGRTIDGETYTIKELENHFLDILEGSYSLQSLPDKAFIEELITPHPFFKKLAPLGLPDVRVIVLNQVPVMALVRVPTEESKGKANQTLGAIGIGIDIRTGITTFATIHKSHFISRLPGTKIKTRGIKIPNWDEVLHLASRTQKASGLGFAGIDVVFDAKKGPMVLEVNARPGLSIQISNKASLRERLERVENLDVGSAARGVELAKSLFAEKFSEKVLLGPRVVTVIEPVTIRSGDKVVTIEAKVDTGAFRSSIDNTLAEELNLKESTQNVTVRSASGGIKKRKTVHINFELAGKKISTNASVVDRSHLTYPMIIGRRDLGGLVINPVVLNPKAPGEEIDEEVEASEVFEI